VTLRTKPAPANDKEIKLAANLKSSNTVRAIKVSRRPSEERTTPMAFFEIPNNIPDDRVNIFRLETQ
jgi:hypothetical protein